MRHLVPFTGDQLTIIENALKYSVKYADAKYCSDVYDILQEIKNNTSIGRSWVNTKSIYQIKKLLEYVIS